MIINKAMTEMIVFTAEIKESKGKGAARALRRNDRIPAILYGGKEDVMLSLIAKDFFKEYSKGNMQSRLVELHLGNKKITAIPRDVQINPVIDFPEHIDFQEVGKDTEIKVAVHVRIINDDKCPGIKKGGVMNVAQRTINFYCHPSSIPSSIDVNVANLEIGQNLHINDLQLPTGVRPVDPHNFAILSISGRAEEKEASPATAEAVDKK
ncbi:MAG: 50S ribosomal protein L25/general stress protein Ctc [Candidatus Midichloria sp.]|nr:50S ribosomal protein L25/general stress protein Ctc [Candidatus Midichloria sp.]